MENELTLDRDRLLAEESPLSPAKEKELRDKLNAALTENDSLKATPHNSDGVVEPSDFSSNNTNRRRLY